MPFFRHVIHALPGFVYPAFPIRLGKEVLIGGNRLGHFFAVVIGKARLIDNLLIG